jgi:hypothetical protein
MKRHSKLDKYSLFLRNTINISGFVPIYNGMHKFVALILFAFASTATPAAWILMDDNYGNADEYFDPSINSKGGLSTIRTFMVLPIRSQVPVYDPSSEPKVKLKLYNAELSVYDVDCKKRTIRLTSRSFYSDRDAKILMVTHGYKDTFIQESNSRFAQQFKVTTVAPEFPKTVRMLTLACKL